MSEMSLLSIMRNDEHYHQRMVKKIQEIKEDKAHLNCIADDYERKYHTEIAEGTKQKAKLLTEGKASGFSEAEVMGQFGRFVPTVQTPILNFLYFFLRENEDPSRYAKRDKINEQLIKHGQLNHEEGDLSEKGLDAFLDDYFANARQQTPVDAKRKEINEQFAKEAKSEERGSLKETPDMITYLYGEVTLDTFNLIKKLKALAQSPHEQEAFLAYRKANDLCKKYGLNFDKIPCYTKK